jgi:ATP/maltotriose-dependent transcriptional regulator MalT
VTPPGAVVVATKFHIPAPRAGLIARDALVCALVEGRERKLALLKVRFWDEEAER